MKKRTFASIDFPTIMSNNIMYAYCIITVILVLYYWTIEFQWEIC